ncbi:hypothetical protein Nmel_016118 [Mimus melanotis]
MFVPLGGKLFVHTHFTCDSAAAQSSLRALGFAPHVRWKTLV